MTDGEIQLWATNNYFPVHQEVAAGQPDHVALAIGMVLTEFECARPPFRFGRNVAAAAVALLDAEDADIESLRNQFIRSLRAEP